MKSMDLLEIIGSIRDKYILEAHNQTATPKKRISSKRLFLIAAIIALMLLLVGCVAVILGLQDLSIGTFSYDAGFGQTKSGEMISMQGYTGSSEYLAAKEWMEFRNGYDTDRAILNELGDSPTNLDSSYSLYSVYTQDMCDKLDEITKKYGLKLHSEMNIVDQEELDYRVGGKFMGENLSRGLAYIYDDGTFQFDGDAQYGNSEILFQCRRAVKGTFDEVTLNVGNIELYQESQYQTQSGETVLLASGPDHGVIIGDFADCFITVNVLGSYEFELTEEYLQFIADSLNYSALKNVIMPDMRGDWTNSPDSANTPTEGTNSETPEEILQSNDPRIAAYQVILDKAMKYHEFPEARDLGYDGSDLSQNQFTLYDIDGDSNDELIFRYTTTYNAGMAEMIYDYDSTTGMIREQFFQYPLVTYYDNGIIMAKASHNHGMGGEFWPYTLFRYNPETDIYDQIASVDAWDKSIEAEDFEGNPFPDSIDQDGDGLVYYVLPYGQNEYGDPMDYTEYEAWLHSNLVDAEEINLTFLELTEQMISDAAIAAARSGPTSAQYEMLPSPQEPDKHILLQVLQNQTLFYSVSGDESVTLSEYCGNESKRLGFEVSITRYALVDMDGDGIQEAIVDFRFGENSQVMCMVLKWDSISENVYGMEFYYRQMSQIKEDGSFAYSGGGDNDGWAKLRWENNDWVKEKVEDSEHKSDVQWYSYPITHN